VVQFSGDSYNVNEGGGEATVIATLSAVSGVTVTVDYATLDGTAEAGSDYTAIKAADPEATVVMGGLAYDRFTEYDGPFLRYFSDEVMQNGGGAYIDVLNIHYFTDFHVEWKRWVPPANPPTCGIVHGDVGTTYDDWRPKPAYNTYQTLTSQLSGYDYVIALEVPNVEGYVFQGTSQQDKDGGLGQRSVELCAGRAIARRGPRGGRDVCRGRRVGGCGRGAEQVRGAAAIGRAGLCGCYRLRTAIRHRNP
jgi:hypothetical protein